MRSFLLGVLLLPAVALAQPVTVEKKITCDKLEVVVEVLTTKYGEQPAWIGDSKSTRVAMLVNTKTSSWTIVQTDGKIACVIEAGEGFQVKSGMFGGKSI